MEDILKLIEIKRQKGHRSIQLLNQNFRKSEISKDNLLFESILQNDLKTDEEAAKAVFKSDPNNRNYRNAKSKLRQKLLNHLYFLDYDKKIYTDYQRYEYEAFHALHQARILLKEGGSDLASKKLLQLLKLAKICEFVDVVVLTLIWLKKEYAQEGKLGLYNEVELAQQYYLKFQAAVRQSEDLYYKELVQINKSYSAQTRALREIPTSIKQIRKNANEFNSTRIEVLAQKLDLLYCKITNNFNQVISICSDIEQMYFHRKDGEIRVDYDQNRIYLTRLEAYFNLSDVKNGLAFCEEKESYFKPGSDQWYRFNELRFLLAMNGKQFQVAGEYFRIVKVDKNFNHLDDLELQRWNIYRAFLIYFNNDKLVKWGFNLNHFLSFEVQFPKDFSGYDIAVHAIRFLYFLRDGDLKGLNLTLTELDKYNSSHLDKRSNYRNSVFIRLINLVPENDFSYETVKEKGQVYMQKLQKTRIPQDSYSDLEVYRYEFMWEEVLQILKTNKEYVHFKFYHFTTS
jgi:hypothetical protein